MNNRVPIDIKTILINAQRHLQLIIVLGFAISFVVLSWQLLPNGGLDMRDDILPSLHNWRAPWLEGTPLFPWAVLVLMPLRLFTPRAATALINGLSVLLTALVIRNLKGNPLFVIPIMVSPFGNMLFFNGQTDAIVLASILLPAGFDLLLFWKPQVIAQAFWVRVRWRPKTYIISGICILLLSLWIWGLWPIEILHFAQVNLINGNWNITLWPYSIPIGMGLLYLSIVKNDVGFGLMASPLLFPYVNGASYIGFLAVIASKWPKVFGVVYTIYFIVLIFMLSHK
jgi:hypothetical protein